MHRPGIIGQALEEVFVGAIVTRREYKITIWQAAQDTLECFSLVGPKPA
jgi:hypothetical protein